MTPLVRHLLADLMRALAVLGLVFLSFAHAPLSVSPSVADEIAGVALGDFCTGHGTIPAHKAPAKCDACRIASGVDLPPTPPQLSAPQAVDAGCQVAADTQVRGGIQGPPLGARAPPSLA